MVVPTNTRRVIQRSTITPRSTRDLRMEHHHLLHQRPSGVQYRHHERNEILVLVHFEVRFSKKTRDQWFDRKDQVWRLVTSANAHLQEHVW